MTKSQYLKLMLGEFQKASREIEGSLTLWQKLVDIMDSGTPYTKRYVPGKYGD